MDMNNDGGACLREWGVLGRSGVKNENQDNCNSMINKRSIRYNFKKKKKMLYYLQPLIWNNLSFECHTHQMYILRTIIKSFEMFFFLLVKKRKRRKSKGKLLQIF